MKTSATARLFRVLLLTIWSTARRCRHRERVDAETASQQLGHSSSAITREFYISIPAIAADVAQVLDELAHRSGDV